MSIALMLEMASTSHPDRDAVVDGDLRLSVAQLSELVDGAAAVLIAAGAKHVAYVGTGGLMVPLLLFGAARAGIPFTPLNYRLSGESLHELIGRLPAPLVVTDDEYLPIATTLNNQAMPHSHFLRVARRSVLGTVPAEPRGDDVAVVLFTSGTTSRPKAVELSHTNLTTYVTGTVELAGSEPTDAILVCVPPYHIAGVGAALTNVYAGRTMVYLRQFDPHRWVQLVNDERITTATVVPTMLDRIVSVLEKQALSLPSLRNLAYGGSKVSLPLVRKALELLPDVGFVNAYGLTETSSTISVLTPEDHRVAAGATQPSVARRLGSVGRPVPGIEIQVRGTGGEILGPGQTGELFVRGAQVSGRYAEIGSALDEDGWFPTRDLASIDAEGFLFLGGRSDDTIIRGAENIAPAEVEDVLVEHPLVHEVAVVGIDDPRWGQIIIAVVVPEAGAQPDPEELRQHVRARLRGSRTPDRVVFREELPTNATGKVVRRALVDSLRSAEVRP